MRATGTETTATAESGSEVATAAEVATPSGDRPRGTASPRPGDGQWALGETTPLNPNEEWKAREGGLAVRARVESRYAAEGFAAMSATDRGGRLRWWGLYTQRRPGIDGGRTATLSTEELEDACFMMRVRIDGGALDLDQLRVLADVSARYARGTADVTDRQNVQFHWIRVEDVPAVWEALERVGLTTVEACGDTPRVIIGSPVAGVAADEIVDGTRAIEEIRRRYIGSEELANLPRKFKTGISGSPHHDVAHELQDVAFVGVVHPEHGPGFDVWVGGGLSTTPAIGVRLGAWVPLEEVTEVWYGIVRVFRDYGYRRLRNRARLKFLVADWGASRFREVLETEYLGRRLLDGPPPPPPPGGRRDHVGVHRQRDGRFYVGVAPLAGRIDAETLTGLVRAVERAGSRRVRLTPLQKIVILDVEAPRVADLLDDLDALGLPARTSAFRRGTMACTGIEFCKLAIVETKATAARLVAELEHRLADVPELFTVDTPPIAVHLNGCPNSCARAQTAGIGLKGIRMRDPADPDGATVDGFQVSLGGDLGPRPRFGRKARGLRTTAADLPDHVERLVRAWLAGREDRESFADWALRAPEEELR
ncbi:MAG: nitrite/sulfite reductase [Actinomycetales bacterium]|nr:nitrite/sulfite reductase [Actinomycetales bacterium]